MANSAPIVDRLRIIPRPRDFLDRNVGSSGEIFYDKSSNTLRLYSGKDKGGYEVVTESTLAKLTSDQNIATVNYTTVVENQGEGNKYILNGEYKPILNFVVGYTYTFDQSDSTNVWYPNAEGTVLNTHPLNFSTNNLSGQLGGGDIYLDNVTYYLDDVAVTSTEYSTNFNIATTRKVSILVTSNTPSTLYYWCTNHLAMGNSITVANPGTGAGASGASIEVSNIAPANPSQGNIWFNTNTGQLYVYLDDGDSEQWVEPSGTFVNAFNTITVSDSSQLTADGLDNINFVEGSGIQILSDTNTNTLQITNLVTGLLDLGINDGTAGQVLSTNGSGGFTFVNAGTGYDQTLNTTDSVTFASITTPNVINNGIGSPEFDSASTITLTAPDGITANGVPLPTHGGYVTLGASPTWTGSSGINSVTQNASGDYTVSFSSAYASVSDYQVVATINDYTNATGVYIPITRGTSSFDMILYREGDGNTVDVGDVMILIYEF